MSVKGDEKRRRAEHYVEVLRQFKAERDKRNPDLKIIGMRAGEFDEHHLEHSGLSKVLGLNFKGVYTGIEVSPDDVWYHTPYGNVIRGDGKILYETTTGKLLNAGDLFENAKAAQVVGNQFGKGKSFWFNTRLGALRPESVEPMVVSNFFGDWLKRGGVKPAYAHSAAEGDRLRVEEPQLTPGGDLAFAVAGVTRFAIPAGKLTVALPAAAKFTQAFWAPAESALMKIRIAKAPMIFSVEITMFSGPWCASSEMSKRSLTSFDIISPVLLRS